MAARPRPARAPPPSPPKRARRSHSAARPRSPSTTASPAPEAQWCYRRPPPSRSPRPRGVPTSTTLAMTVVPASAASFAITDAQGASVTAGQTDQLTVTAKDAYGNVATSYTRDHDDAVDGGQTSPSSSAATVTSKTGAPIAFGSTTTLTFNNGVTSAGGAMVLPKATAQSITATASGVPTSTTLAMAVFPAAAHHLAVSNEPTTVTAGQAAPVRVTSYDTYGNVASGYTGTVALGSDDGSAVIPAGYTFTGGDAGVHDFSGAATVTLKSVGSRHVTVNDPGLPVTSATSGAI